VSHYSLVFVTPKTDTWIADYLKVVGPLVQKHGGKYLARTASHERIEGTAPNPGVIVILEWPSRAAAEAFYGDPAYEPQLKARLAGAASELFLVEGKDDFV
jgi:uncharacterized protein (DUF1330 family)